MVWKSNIQTILEIWTWKLLSCVQLFATPRTTQSNPVDYTVHGMLQARILEWVAVPFYRGSSQPRDQAEVSHTAGGFFTSWATREALNLDSKSCMIISEEKSIHRWLLITLKGVENIAFVNTYWKTKKKKNCSVRSTFDLRVVWISLSPKFL